MAWDIVDVDKSEPNVFGIAFFLIISFVLFVVLVGWTILFFKAEVSNVLNVRQITPLSSERQDLKLYEDSLLLQYSWVNKELGYVRIPIDVALNRYINNS